MTCGGCGAQLEEGALLCRSCGRVLSSEEVAKQRAEEGKLTRKEFYRLPGMKACRNNIKGCAIMLYVCSAMTTLASLLWEVLEDPTLRTSWVDGVLLLGLGLWLHFGKSRICAALTLGYGLFGTIMVFMNAGVIRGWWIPLAGGWALVYTFKFHNLWGKYKRNGELPDEAVKE